MTETTPIAAAFATARQWAKARLASGHEPPWSYYRLMQLLDAMDALEAGRTVILPDENSNVVRLERQPPPDFPMPA